MDSFEWNKIAGAVLAALLVGFGLSIFSEILFETETPEHPGYVIAVAEPEAGEETAGDGAAKQPIAVLLASADAAAGESSAKKCATCHTFTQGGRNGTGPNLWEVVNRAVASVQGYGYSEALTGYAAQSPTWTFESLDTFLHDPKGTVPGTKMAFAGLKNDPERANVIAYLRSLSPNPAPLPEAPPPGAEAAAAPDATPGSEAGTAGPGPGRPEEGVQAGAGAGEGGGEGGTAGQDNTQPQGSLGPLDSTTADQQGGVPQVAPIEEEAPEPGAAPSAQGQSDMAADGQGQPGAPAQPGPAEQPAPPADPQARTPQPDVAPADTPAAQPAPAQPAQPAPAAPAPEAAAPAPAQPAAPAVMPRPVPAPPPTPAPQAPAAAVPTAPVPTAPAPAPLPAPPPQPAAPVAPSPAPGQQGAAQPAAPAQQIVQAAAPAQQIAQAAAPAAEAGAPAPGGFVALVAAADPAKGQAAFRRCAACHTVTKDGGNKVGPKMWGVVNRPIASVPDYAYSDAMKAFSAGGQKTWTYAELDPYLLNPKAHVPGTKMIFPGIKKDDERASVVAYLRTLADAPAPLQ